MKKLLFVLLCTPILIFSQEKLKKAKNKLNQNTTISSSSGSQSNTTRNTRRNTRRRARKTSSKVNKNYTHQAFQSVLLEIAFYATVGIVSGQAQERDLNPYPYFYDNEGEYAAELSETGKKQNLRIGANYLFNKISAFELNALYKPLPILGIEASHLHFTERNRQEKEILDVTSLMANYYRLRDKKITFWFGAGITYVGNEVNKLGFAYTLGTEVYPFKPISLHLSWKESFINQDEIGVFKSQIKYHFKKNAIYAGYHHFQIASQDISGPIIGFEYSF